MKLDSVTVYAGPSAHGLAPALKRAASRWLPPARRGDVACLVAAQEPGVLVLCDGHFDIVPAVSHAELCDALDAGWQVWGVSSIGAIRAWEMRDEGMHGYGRVHAMFAQKPDFTDDEMCLLHCPEEPYFPVTEALVNVRVALEEHGEACGIGIAQAARLIERLAARWFGERSEELIASVLVEELGIDVGACDAWLSRLRAHRIKNRDLAALLQARPWQVALRG